MRISVRSRIMVWRGLDHVPVPAELKRHPNYDQNGNPKADEVPLAQPTVFDFRPTEAQENDSRDWGQNGESEDDTVPQFAGDTSVAITAFGRMGHEHRDEKQHCLSALKRTKNHFGATRVARDYQGKSSDERHSECL